MAHRFLTRTQARAALGEAPERTFARWCAQGLPVKGDGKTARYPWPEIFRWLLEQTARRARDQAKPAQTSGARDRRELAEAELAELRLEEQRGNLMTVTQFDQGVSAAFGRVRGKLLAVPQRHAASVVGLTSAPAALGQLDIIVRELMEELHGEGKALRRELTEVGATEEP